MRKDMYKVIVERPRRSKHNDAAAARLRRDFDSPMHLGMRAGYVTLPPGRIVVNLIDGELRRHTLAAPRYDAVMRKNVSRAKPADLRQCREEIKAHQLSRDE